MALDRNPSSSASNGTIASLIDGNGEIDVQGTHNDINEITVRDIDTDCDGQYDDTQYSLIYNTLGQLTDDRQHYEYSGQAPLFLTSRWPFVWHECVVRLSSLSSLSPSPRAAGGWAWGARAG